MTTIKRLTYDDPIVESQLRAYADTRGFAQLTISRADTPNVLRTVRIRDEALDELIEVLRAARAGQPDPGALMEEPDLYRPHAALNERGHLRGCGCEDCERDAERGEGDDRG